jgi:hypothetical protein
VFVSQGTLVFDGVAISDTRANVVRTARACARGGRPAADGRCAQNIGGGGAVCMGGGTVTFKGNSSIRSAGAVRFAQRTRAQHALTGMRKHTSPHARTHAQTSTQTTHACTHTQARTHKHACAHTRTLAQAHELARTHTLNRRKQTYTHTDTRARAHTRTDTHTRARTHTLAEAPMHARTRAHARARTQADRLARAGHERPSVCRDAPQWGVQPQVCTQAARAAHAAYSGHAGLGRVLIAAAAARVQCYGGAVYIKKGTLVLDGVAISGTRALVRPLGLAHGGRVAGGGPRRTGGVRRMAAQCTWKMGPSRSKGAARSRTPRCASPNTLAHFMHSQRTHPHACTHRLAQANIYKRASSHASTSNHTHSHERTHARKHTHTQGHTTSRKVTSTYAARTRRSCGACEACPARPGTYRSGGRACAGIRRRRGGVHVEWHARVRRRGDLRHARIGATARARARRPRWRAARGGRALCAGERRRSVHGRWDRHVPRGQLDHGHRSGALRPNARARVHVHTGTHACIPKDNSTRTDTRAH